MTFRAVMKQSHRRERVERLLESGLCKSDNPEKDMEAVCNNGIWIKTGGQIRYYPAHKIDHAVIL